VGKAYEIRSYLAPTSLCLDVDGASKANGANVMLGTVNHGNNQKFYVVDEGDGYSIKDMNGGKYIDVAGGTFASGSNVQIYSDNDSRAQRWKLSKAGSKAIDGQACDVVSFGAGNGTSYWMDVSDAIAANRQNVQIWAGNGSDAQKWVLVPTDRVDASLPAPAAPGLDYVPGTYSTVVYKRPASKLYPHWNSTKAWVASSLNIFQLRWRKRYKKGATQTWTDWTDWTDWAKTTNVVNYGVLASGAPMVWDATGIAADYTFADGYVNEEIEVQVRGAVLNSDGTVELISEACDGTKSVIRRPKTTITQVGWSNDGLRVGFETDYPFGGLLTAVFAVKFDGKSALVKNTEIANGLFEPTTTGAKGSFVIPVENLKAAPKDGAKLNLLVYTANDELGIATEGDQTRYDGTVEYDAGTVDVTPTVTLIKEGLLFKAVVPYADTVKMWLTVGDDVRELEGTVEGGTTVFMGAFPFGDSFTLSTSYVNADGTEWGTDTTEFKLDAPKCHAWNWDGGYLILWLDTDYLTEKRSYSTQSEEHVLAGRSKPVVSYLADSDGDNELGITSTVTGVLMPDDAYGCTADDVESLLKAGHVTYRSPQGRMVSVAVTSADVTVSHSYTEVSIDHTEEQL
jgi:hypothetical protein